MYSYSYNAYICVYFMLDVHAFINSRIGSFKFSDCVQNTQDTCFPRELYIYIYLLFILVIHIDACYLSTAALYMFYTKSLGNIYALLVKIFAYLFAKAIDLIITNIFNMCMSIHFFKYSVT